MIYNGNLINSVDINELNNNNNTNNNKNNGKETIYNDGYINELEKCINKLTQFSVVHPQNIENKFKKAKETCYLYHGSRQENWYSIMRNGLKVGSLDNKLLVNGTAYGTGIYLSDIVNFSINYSNSENIIVGVCQVIDNKDKWKKGTNIYVVQDEKQVILKYLLIFENKAKITNNFNNDIMQILNIKFNSNIHKEIVTKQTQVSSLRNKRLMKEYKMLMEQDTKLTGFRIELPKEDCLDVWNIYIKSDWFEGNPKIQKDMEEYGIKEIELEFRFNENYPVQPPFVRIVYPRFIYLTGHITLGGSICMELLTNQGWDITTSISTVITYVKSAILEGDGKIDPKKKHKYEIEEAHEAFNRMLKSHGWI
jgi:ubiquitin-protein ligase